MPSVRTPTYRLARHGILATAILLGITLVLTTWTAWRNAEALADTLSEGQGELYLQGMRNRSGPGRPRDEVFERMLAEFEEGGLRGIGVVESDGTMRRIAGSFTETPYPGGRGPRGRDLRRVGDRYQVTSPPPPAHRGPPPGFPPPPEHAAGPLVFEFEPLLASGLTLRARQTFFLTAGSAVLLVSAAIVLSRRAAREEGLAARLAHSERLASLGTMSAVLAHEIKNPLAALKGNAQLVAESLSPDSRTRGQAERVVEAALRLQGLVQNLLDFARGGPIERAETDPAELLFLAAEDAAPTATLDLDHAPASWSLDAIRMRQVLENLLRNAVQSSKKGEITARVSLEGERLEYVVCDDGPGFPEGSTESIFEPFVTTKTRGVGLGLSVARRIVSMHGGEIVARNRPEGGAELRVSIPRA